MIDSQKPVQKIPQSASVKGRQWDKATMAVGAVFFGLTVFALVRVISRSAGAQPVSGSQMGVAMTSQVAPTAALPSKAFTSSTPPKLDSTKMVDHIGPRRAERIDGAIDLRPHGVMTVDDHRFPVAYCRPSIDLRRAGILAGSYTIITRNPPALPVVPNIDLRRLGVPCSRQTGRNDLTQGGTP